MILFLVGASGVHIGCCLNPGKRQEPATKQVQYKHEAAGNQPNRKAQAGKRQKENHQADTRHGTKTSQPTNYRRASGKTEPQTRYKHETARNQPKRKAQAGKRQKENHQADTSKTRHENEPTHQLQAGKRQEPATKQVQARNGTKRAKPQSAGRQAPRTSQEAGTSTKRHETSQAPKSRQASAKNQPRSRYKHQAA